MYLVGDELKDSKAGSRIVNASPSEGDSSIPGNDPQSQSSPSTHLLLALTSLYLYLNHPRVYKHISVTKVFKSEGDRERLSITQFSVFTPGSHPRLALSFDLSVSLSEGEHCCSFFSM